MIKKKLTGIVKDFYNQGKLRMKFRGFQVPDGMVNDISDTTHIQFIDDYLIPLQQSITKDRGKFQGGEEEVNDTLLSRYKPILEKFYPMIVNTVFRACDADAPQKIKEIINTVDPLILRYEKNYKTNSDNPTASFTMNTIL